jgi:S1-C subfamily serine protease
VAGLRSGDILLALDGVAMTGPDALLRRLASDAIDRPMPARLIRGGRFLDLDLTPAERAKPAAAGARPREAA